MPEPTRKLPPAQGIQPPATDLLPTAPTLLVKLRDSSDQSSWQRFHDTYARLLKRFAVRAGLSPDEADDVVQDTLVEIVEKMPSFRYEPERCTFKSWLQVIVHRRVSDRFRRRQYRNQGQDVKRETPLELQAIEHIPIEDHELENAWDEEWRTHVLDGALARVRGEVKPEQFQMFHLHVIRNVSAKEVAERFHVSVMVVYWAKIHVGRKVTAAMKEIETVP